jgi:hypothetical protein
MFFQKCHEKKRYKRRKHGGTFYVYMDHSQSHDGVKIQEKFDRKRFVRCPHTPSSPDLGSCDFWSLEWRRKK